MFGEQVRAGTHTTNGEDAALQFKLIDHAGFKGIFELVVAMHQGSIGDCVIAFFVHAMCIARNAGVASAQRGFPFFYMTE
jgi:hypothetical protein